MGQFQLTTAKNSVANQIWVALRQILPVLEAKLWNPALLYDPTRCDTPLVKTQWILDFYRDKPSSLLRVRILNAKEARTTRPDHAKLRDASRPRYSHSKLAIE
jgi:hypothetical protein